MKLCDYLKKYKKNIVNINPEFFYPYVCKINSKKIVGDMVGNDLLIPTILIFEHYDEFLYNLHSLPSSFMIKANNGSGRNLKILNKKDINHEKLKKTLEFWKINPYNKRKEKQYIFPTKFLVEDYITDIKTEYRFWCFDNECKFISCSKPKPSNSFSYYDIRWNKINVSKIYKNKHYLNPDVVKPKELNNLINLSSILSKNFKFVCIDFLESERFFFSEFTFTPGNGNVFFTPHDIFYSLPHFYPI